MAIAQWRVAQPRYNVIRAKRLSFLAGQLVDVRLTVIVMNPPLPNGVADLIGCRHPMPD